MPQESEVIKQKCFDEINNKIAKIKEKQGDDQEPDIGYGTKKENEPETMVREKETKSISLNKLFKTTKTIKSEDDIEEVLNEIRAELKNILDEDKNIKLI
jgi:hypothetical protein